MSSSSTKDLRRELGKKELFGIAVGQVIGAGIMVLVGMGIASTGRSVNVAFVLSAVWVILMSIPWIFISGCVRLRGGEYTQISVLCGEKFAGFYIVLYLVRNLQMPIYVLAFADYFLSLVPGVNHKLVCIICATFFFGLNVFPTKFMAQVQNLMVIALCAALAAFVVYGMPEVQPGYWDEPGFMTSGVLGLLSTSAFLTFATFGANSIFQLSGECKNPTKDIPFVLITATFLVAVLYGIIAMVAAGVLPLEEVANQNLSVVAKKILSEPLYLFFVVGGALGAIATSLNATIAWATKPLIQACEDGWFPKKFAHLHSTYKTPIYLISFFYIASLLPILLDLPIKELTGMTLILMYSCMIVSSLATIRLPDIFPEQWARSPFRCNRSLLALVCIIATATLGVQIYFLAGDLDMKSLVYSVSVMIVAALYATYRYKSGGVKVAISHEDD